MIAYTYIYLCVWGCMYPVDVVGGGTQGGVTILWGGGRVREDETRDHI